MSQLPIRLRLTLAFAAVMALLLAALFAFLYARFAAQLDDAIDDGLRARASTLSALARERDGRLAGSGLRENLAEEGESFAQIVAGDGRVVLDAATHANARAAPLTPDQLRRATRQRLVVETFAAGDDEARLLAVPVQVGGQRLVAMVGTSLEDREHALRELLQLMLIGGPVALALASLAGYGVAAAALRPVETMRQRTAAVSAEEPGRRLPVPRARDEIARLGHTLNDMLARLEASLERERRFVSNASHELRTPLAILKAELELALRRARSAEELEATVRSAAEEADRLAGLAEDLLVLARSDEGRLPIRRTRANVTELLAVVARRFEARALEQGRRLDVRARDELWTCADSLRLEQALGNLVDNTLRHGAGTVTLQARSPDECVELHVTDQGQGFTASFLPHAFQRFSRGEHGRTGEGTGLGLAIVAVIAHAHGGSAHAANRDGGGADVWLSLPPIKGTRRSA